MKGEVIIVNKVIPFFTHLIVAILTFDWVLMLLIPYSNPQFNSALTQMIILTIFALTFIIIWKPFGKYLSKRFGISTLGEDRK